MINLGKTLSVKILIPMINSALTTPRAEDLRGRSIPHCLFTAPSGEDDEN